MSNLRMDIVNFIGGKIFSGLMDGKRGKGDFGTGDLLFAHFINIIDYRRFYSRYGNRETQGT